MFYLVLNSLHCLCLPYQLQAFHACNKDIKEGGSNKQNAFLFIQSIKMIRIFEHVLIILGMGVSYIIWLPLVVELLSSNRIMNFLDTISTGVFLLPLTSVISFYPWIKKINNLIDSVLLRPMSQWIGFIFDFIKQYFFIVLYVPLVVVSIYALIIQHLSLPLVCLVFGHVVSILNYFGLISNNYKETVLYNALMWVQVFSVLKSDSLFRVVMNLFMSLNELQAVFLKVNKPLRSIYKALNNYSRWAVNSMSLLVVVASAPIYFVFYQQLSVQWALIKAGGLDSQQPFMMKVFMRLRHSLASALSWLVDKVCPNFCKTPINYLVQCICFIEVCTWVLMLRLVLFVSSEVYDFVRFFIAQLKIALSLSGSSNLRKIINNIKLKGCRNIFVKHILILYVLFRGFAHYCYKSYRSLKSAPNKHPVTSFDRVHELADLDQYCIDTQHISGLIFDNGDTLLTKRQQQSSTKFPRELLIEALNNFKDILENEEKYKEQFDVYWESEVGAREKKYIDFYKLPGEIEEKLTNTNALDTQLFINNLEHLLRKLNKRMESPNEQQIKCFYYDFSNLLVGGLIWCIPKACNKTLDILRGLSPLSAKALINEEVFQHRQHYFNKITNCNGLVDKNIKELDAFLQKFNWLPHDAPLLYNNMKLFVIGYLDEHNIVDYKDDPSMNKASDQYVFDRLLNQHSRIMDNKSISVDQALLDDMFTIFNLYNYYLACNNALVTTLTMRTLDSDYHENQITNIAIGFELGIIKDTYLQQWVNVDVLKHNQSYTGLSLSYQMTTPAKHLVDELRNNIWRGSSEILEAMAHDRAGHLWKSQEEIVRILEKQLGKCTREYIHDSDIQHYAIAYLCGPKHEFDFIIEMLKVGMGYKGLIEEVNTSEDLEKQCKTSIDSADLEKYTSINRRIQEIESSIDALSGQIDVNKDRLKKVRWTKEESAKINQRLEQLTKTLSEKKVEKACIKRDCPQLESYSLDIKKLSLAEDVKRFKGIHSIAQDLVPALLLLNNGILRPKNDDNPLFKSKRSLKETVSSVFYHIKIAIFIPLYTVTRSIVVEHKNLVIEVISIPLVQRFISFSFLLISVALPVLLAHSAGQYIVSQMFAFAMMHESWNQSGQGKNLLQRLFFFFWHPKPFQFLASKIKTVWKGEEDWRTTIFNLACCSLPPLRASSLVVNQLCSSGVRSIVPLAFNPSPVNHFNKGKCNT